MTRENVFAYTAPGSQYPGYISANRLESGDVEVSVRAAPCIIDETRTIMGECAVFTIPAAEWNSLTKSALLDEAERVVEVFARCPTQGKEGGRFVIANAIYEDMGKGKSAPREAYWHKSDFDKARAFLTKLRKEQDDGAV